MWALAFQRVDAAVMVDQQYLDPANLLHQPLASRQFTCIDYFDPIHSTSLEALLC
jgi:hypothetical protein